MQILVEEASLSTSNPIIGMSMQLCLILQFLVMVYTLAKLVTSYALCKYV